MMTPPEEVQTNCSSSTALIGLKGGCRNSNDMNADGGGSESDKSRKSTERYKEKYRLLSLRSTMLQQENEELANKLTTIKETIRKARKIRRQLLQKLDADNDAWRLGSISRDQVAAPIATTAHTNSKPASVQLRPTTTPTHPTRSSPPIIPLAPLSRAPTTTTTTST